MFSQSEIGHAQTLFSIGQVVIEFALVCIVQMSQNQLGIADQLISYFNPWDLSRRRKLVDLED